MSIDVQNVSKRFGAFVALDSISFSVPAGELVARIWSEASRLLQT